jgi:peptidoglycan/LPS O-acetylase OafA/YrhL
MTTTHPDTLRFPPFWAAAIDGALVLVFVLIGRASHDEDPVLGALTTYWPFLVGLLLGWLVTRGWRAPLALVRTALPVWAVTVVAGMLLRAVTGQGVQAGFVIVTCVVLAVFLIGWRAVARSIVRRQSRRALTRT